MNYKTWNMDNFDDSMEYYDNDSGYDYNYEPRGPGGWQRLENWRGGGRGGWDNNGQDRDNWGPFDMRGPPGNWGTQNNWGPQDNWGHSGDGNPQRLRGPGQSNFNDSGPDFGWGKGFGPDGPPMATAEVAFRHLLRCKVPKEYIKNLPKDLLKMFGPNRCGICEVNFDSFVASRGHYLSKGHYKKQKRCVAQKCNDAIKRPNKKESPLLPRSKYCELCDVQITSEAHAESHYAGRSHRAIVIGNKGPKNESLLRKEMGGRIAQLINREKIFIDTVEVQKPEEPQAQPKDCPPELYCDICKTFVTCSEQMRMHLNGKRHLAKEKQHILKMMTVPTQKDKATPAEQAENEDAEAEIKADADGNGDKFDWGNGSEAWEEDKANNQQTTVDDSTAEN